MGKVMFSRVSVILSTGEGASRMQPPVCIPFPVSGCNHPPPPTPEDRRSTDGRYAYYWNAYLLLLFLQKVIQIFGWWHSRDVQGTLFTLAAFSQCAKLTVDYMSITLSGLFGFKFEIRRMLLNVKLWRKRTLSGKVIKFSLPSQFLYPLLLGVFG